MNYSYNNRPSSDTLIRGERKKRRKYNVVVSCAAAVLIALLVVIIVLSLSLAGNESTKASGERFSVEGTIALNNTEITNPDTTSVTTDNSADNADTTDTTASTDSTDTAADTTETASQTEPTAENTTSKGYKIEVVDGVTYVDGILIANKTYSLPSDYGTGLTSEMRSALNSMYDAAAEDGIHLQEISGFRPYATQQTLYNNYCKRDGQEAADTYSARPGHSEHQTGLAADINSLETSFGETAEGKWLKDNCYKFGFIIRYPEGKESATGYQYEPWHVRYLGVDIATKVTESGVSLEEYLGIDSEYKTAE